MLQEPLDNLEDDMTPEEMSKSVSDCKNEIDKLSHKINEIQHECRHSEYDVKTIGVVPVQVKKICKICQLDLGYPTSEELKKAGY